MSRRSAVATDTGTTGATFARAEPGLGSLPPQPDRDTPSNRRSPSQGIGAGNRRRTDSAEVLRKPNRCPSLAASALWKAVVIRGPLCQGKNDEFSIIVVAHGSMPKSLTFKFQLRLRNIAPLMKRHIAGFYSC